LRSIYQRLSFQKVVEVEPKGSARVNEVTGRYKDGALNTRGSGAVLLGVCRGKVQ